MCAPSGLPCFLGRWWVGAPNWVSNPFTPARAHPRQPLAGPHGAGLPSRGGASLRVGTLHTNNTRPRGGPHHGSPLPCGGALPCGGTLSYGSAFPSDGTIPSGGSSSPGCPLPGGATLPFWPHLRSAHHDCRRLHRTNSRLGARRHTHRAATCPRRLARLGLGSLAVCWYPRSTITNPPCWRCSRAAGCKPARHAHSRQA
jgi:hypothetical protein